MKMPSTKLCQKSPVWKSKFYGAFVLNLRVDLHAIMRRLLDGVAMPVRHRREMTW